ncbi:PREDICTED: LOW QUALITY PROTEIN: 3-ketoacyl-CoA synthase 7 [Theobroma cacao]|uniref:LOW QUALITY PROTEIN: 3-ketoacyl-CoA synthase 7 n=1 Tax=Theobroma cacao TaxID=3641 RepID=A0AB32VWU3_THECC|nr:PREDICTED: LOW QUALITY PROTEIN: 3-ketoacyl-CoA synthase 7 [Theobroma cacao]
MVPYYTTRVQYFVYPLDFNCYCPPDNLRGILDYFVEYFETFNIFDRQSIDFQVKVYERAGVGNESCVPRSVHEIPFNGSLSGAREEIEEVLFTAVRDLLSKHKIDPKSIDIQVSNCSIFCPTPSITAMVINKFRFRSDIKSFTHSGVGCSAGILSIGLVKDLLKVHKNSLALVLRMEAITPSFYTGKSKSMLVTNTLFAFGSGFKTNSAVWKCISELDHKETNAWSDRIHRHPVDIPSVLDH